MPTRHQLSAIRVSIPYRGTPIEDAQEILSALVDTRLITMNEDDLATLAVVGHEQLWYSDPTGYALIGLIVVFGDHALDRMMSWHETQTVVDPLLERTYDEHARRLYSERCVERAVRPNWGVMRYSSANMEVLVPENAHELSEWLRATRDSSLQH